MKKRISCEMVAGSPKLLWKAEGEHEKMSWGKLIAKQNTSRLGRRLCQIVAAIWHSRLSDVVSCTECGSETFSFLALTSPQTSSALGKTLQNHALASFLFLFSQIIRAGIIMCRSIIIGGDAACSRPCPKTLYIDMAGRSPRHVVELDYSLAWPPVAPSLSRVGFSFPLICHADIPIPPVVPLRALLGLRLVLSLPVAPCLHLPEL